VKEPTFNYDEESDVMYISFGESKPCKTEDHDSGLCIRHELNGSLNGITIIDYNKRTNKE